MRPLQGWALPRARRLGKDKSTAAVVTQHQSTDPLITISGQSDGSVIIQSPGNDDVEVKAHSSSVSHIMVSTPFSGWVVIVHEDGKIFGFKLRSGEKVDKSLQPSAIKTPSPVLRTELHGPVCVMKNDMVAFLCSSPPRIWVWNCEKEAVLASHEVAIDPTSIFRMVFQDTRDGAFAGLAVVTNTNAVYLCDVAKGIYTAAFKPPVSHPRLVLLAIRKFFFISGPVIIVCKWDNGIVAAYDRRDPRPLHYVAKEAP